MRGINSRIYMIGVLMTLFGGAGLEGISLTNHGCFWLCNIMFSVGVGICAYQVMGMRDE